MESFENSEMIIHLDSFSRLICNILVFFDISIFGTTAIIKFAKSQYFPLAPFASFIGSLMRL